MKPVSKLGVLLLAMSMSAAAGDVMAATARLRQLDAWTLADSDGDGGLSREEARHMPRLARHFDAIDGNGDGVISGAEVRLWREATRAAKRVVKALAPSRGVEEILRIADRDGDGRLSRAEFRQGLPRFARRFEYIDADRDEHLSREELAQWIATLRSVRRSK